MNKNIKRFIAQQGGTNLIKIFNAGTGQLYRVITVNGQITAPPYCTDTELCVGVRGAGGEQTMHIYSISTFGLKRVTPV